MQGGTLMPANTRIFTMPFRTVYPLYIIKAEKKRESRMVSALVFCCMNFRLFP
jgi:hypothetical protein